MTRFKRCAPGLLGLTLLSAVGCGGKGEKAAEGSSEVKPISITVTDLGRKSVARTVDVAGTLRGWEEVTVGAKKGGRVLKVFHDFGDTIKPGEPLIELEAVDAKLALRQAETQLLSELTRLGVTRKQADEYLAKHGGGEKLLNDADVAARINEVPAVVQAKVTLDRTQVALARQRQINARGVGTAEVLQNAENDHDAARAAVDNAVMTARSVLASALSTKVAIDIAQQTLDDLIIRAPIPSSAPSDPKSTGGAMVYSIAKRQVHEGQMVKDGEALFNLVILQPLRLSANVPEGYAPEVKIGQEVRLTVAARPGQTFIGSIARISPSVDEVSRTFVVEAIVPNPDGLLLPGGFAKAEIVTRAEAQAVIVPIESVVKYAGVTKIFVVEDGKSRAIPVETGIEGKDWVEVSGNLPTQGQVVTSGQAMLADGTPVTVRVEPKPDAAKPATDAKPAAPQKPASTAKS